MTMLLFVIALVFSIGAIAIAVACGHSVLAIGLAVWAAIEIRDVIRKEID